MNEVFFPSLRQIRTFIAVAQTNNMCRAAAELRLSQSALTQAVAKLEAALGTTLFVRRTKGSYLTELGEIYYRRITRFLEGFNDAVREVLLDGAPANIDLISRRITKAQILTLVAINGSASFAQAARHVGLSLSSLYRSAHTLQDNLQSPIFHDTAQGITTNKQGSILAKRLQLATRELEWGREEVEAAKGLVQGRILIGALNMGGSYLLASVLGKFSSLHPDAAIIMTNAAYDVLLSQLRTGALDFVVGLTVHPAPADDVVAVPLYPDPYVVAVRHGHPLTRKCNVTGADLSKFAWITPFQTSKRRDAFERLFRGGPRPRAGIETHSLATKIVLLSSSDRLAFLTESEMMFDRELGNRLTPLDVGPLGPSDSIVLTTRGNWLPTRLQQSFLEFLRSESGLRFGNVTPIAAE